MKAVLLMEKKHEKVKFSKSIFSHGYAVRQLSTSSCISIKKMYFQQKIFATP